MQTLSLFNRFSKFYLGLREFITKSAAIVRLLQTFRGKKVKIALNNFVTPLAPWLNYETTSTALFSLITSCVYLFLNEMTV